MKKSSLFISAILTTFVLAVLAGVFTAYRSVSASTQVSASQPAAVVQAVVISPQDASQIAARFIGRSDLYTVATTSINGSSAYMVTFSSGDVVYVNLQGQVLSVVSAPAANTTTNSPSFSPSTSSGGEHEDGD